MEKGNGGAGFEAGTCLWKYMSVQNTSAIRTYESHTITVV